MYFRTEMSFTMKQKEQLKKELGINYGGKVQKTLDATIIRYLRQNMPQDSGIMISNTKAIKSGIILIDVPYAHYINEGILYINPEHNSTGWPFIINQRGENVGFKGKRVPSNRKLKNYYAENGGPGRGAHFVERTIYGQFDDILKEAKKGVRK